ncbi:A24 family peptidase [Aureimonas populi]|uniref:Prepilin peptidase n=1 Tax=Aureimonas populi TaxID=1701758 RepID=A0ABW5CMC7_9HYPH|nr:prepilin peptidase [Aureimonas populi]
MLEALITLFFVPAMILAMVSDIRSMTIPNRLCLFLVAAFAVSALAAGMAPAAIGIHALTGLLVLALTFCLFALNWMGGGDAKLIAATALWFGPGAGLADYVLLSALFGGALTLCLLGARALARPATGIVFLDRLLHPRTGVPYGVALGAAGIIVFLQGPFAATLP